MITQALGVEVTAWAALVALLAAIVFLIKGNAAWSRALLLAPSDSPAGSRPDGAGDVVEDGFTWRPEAS